MIQLEPTNSVSQAIHRVVTRQPLCSSIEPYAKALDTLVRALLDRGLNL